MDGEEKPQTVQQFRVLHSNLGMLVAYRWTAEQLAEFQQSMSRTLQPAETLAVFLRDMAVEVSFTSVQPSGPSVTIARE